MKIRSIFIVGLALASAMSMPTEASARGGFARSHPGRAHINHRIAHQQARITHEVRQGDLTRAEGRQLHQDVHQVRVQERAYAHANGNNGHLTAAQRRDLNRQLNRTSRRIGH